MPDVAITCSSTAADTRQAVFPAHLHLLSKTSSRPIAASIPPLSFVYLSSDLSLSWPLVLLLFACLSLALIPCTTHSPPIEYVCLAVDNPPLLHNSLLHIQEHIRDIDNRKRISDSIPRLCNLRLLSMMCPTIATQSVLCSVTESSQPPISPFSALLLLPSPLSPLSRPLSQHRRRPTGRVRHPCHRV